MAEKGVYQMTILGHVLISIFLWFIAGAVSYNSYDETEKDKLFAASVWATLTVIFYWGILFAGGLIK